MRVMRCEGDEDPVQSVQVAPVAQLNDRATFLLVMVIVAKLRPWTADTFTHFHPPPELAPRRIVLVTLILLHRHTPS